MLYLKGPRVDYVPSETAVTKQRSRFPVESRSEGETVVVGCRSEAVVEWRLLLRSELARDYRRVYDALSLLHSLTLSSRPHLARS